LFNFLVTGVERALFHAPSIIIGYVDGEYIDLSNGTLDNVYTIMTTSADGIIIDNKEPPPNIMVAGEKGSYPLMVFEIDWAKKNTIIATGESPFDQDEGMYMPELGNPERYGPTGSRQQGTELMENILKYGTTFGATIIDQASMIMDKEAEIAGLESDVSDLEDEVTALDGDISDLAAEVASLESDVVGLEADVAAAQSSASIMQLAVVAALVIGVVVGYFVGPMIKKQ
jgi:outer membrane murein-binding lipoprotein Lpp